MPLLGRNLPNLTVAPSDIWSGDTVQFWHDKPIHYSLGLSLHMLSQNSSCACEFLGLQGQPQLHLCSLGARCCMAIYRIPPSRLAGLWLSWAPDAEWMGGCLPLPPVLCSLPRFLLEGLGSPTASGARSLVVGLSLVDIWCLLGLSGESFPVLSSLVPLLILRNTAQRVKLFEFGLQAKCILHLWEIWVF